jgi:TolA-binding protein
MGMDKIYTYEVSKTHKKDPSLSVVRKSGITAEFTMQELISERLTMEKRIKELEGQKKINDATVKNIEDHHPEVMKMDPELRSYAASYDEALADKHNIDKVLKAYKKAIKEDNKERKIVADTIGMKIGEDGK